MKKLFAILLISVLTVFGGSGVLAEPLSLPGRLLLASFNDSDLNPLIFSRTAQIKQSAERTYDNVSYSLEWTLANGEFEIGYFSDVQSWKNYQNVKIRLYCEYSGNNFNVVFIPKNTFSGTYSQLKVEAKAGWNEISIPISSLSTFFTNCANETNGNSGYIRVNLTGWGNSSYTVGHKIYLDRIYLSAPETAETFSSVSSDIESGADFVPAALDGHNAFNITFGEGLWNSDYTGAVSVYENGTDTLSSASFQTAVNNKILSVIFDNPLTAGKTYYIMLRKGKIYSQSGRSLAEDELFYFTVGTASPFFKIISQSGNKTDSGYTYNLVFNNTVGNSDGNITIYKDNIKLLSGFSISVSAKSVIVSLNNAYSPGSEYKIVFGSGFCDAYGNTLTGENTVSFNTPAESGVLVDFVMFSADNSSDLAYAVSNGASASSEEPNLYDSAAKIAFNPSTDKTVALSNKHIDAGLYKYVNYWIYSPAVSQNKFNLMLYSSRAQNEYFRYSPTADWTGWKLVSYELSSFAANNASANIHDINQTTFNLNGWSNTWAAGGYFLVEKMWLSAEKPASPKLIGYSKPLGYSEMPCDGTVSLYYDSVLTAPGDEIVSLTSMNSESENSFIFGVNGKTLAVSFEGLAPAVQYTIRVNKGVKNASGLSTEAVTSYTFKTSSTGLSAWRPLFSDSEFPTSSGVVTAEYTLLNRNAASRSAVIYLVLYDENRLLTEVKKQTVTIEAGDSQAFLLTSENVGKAVCARAFVLDNSSNIISETAFLGAVSEDAKPIYTNAQSGAGSINLDESSIDVNLLSIAGTAVNICGNVLVTVSGNGGDILTIPVLTGTNGKFSYDILLDSAVDSGVYTIKAVLDGKTAQKSLTYLKDVDRADILNTLNNGAQSEIFSMLKQYKEVFNLNGLSDAVIRGISETLSERKPYTAWRNAIDTTNSSVTLLDGLNNSSWSALSGYLASNSVIIMNGTNADYDYYKSLSQKEQNIINQAVVKGLPIDGFGAFRIIFSSAVAGYKNSLNNQVAGGGSVSAGGGAGGGGGGSTVSFDSSVTALPKETPIEAAEIFNDLSSAEWARESIMKLYNAGVITRPDDKKFRPLDNVTREEFVKMIILALNADISNNESVFTDTEENGWYNPYIKAAKELGIVNGYSDGSFGIGQNITREDMASMAYRAISVLGKKLKASDELDEEFTDAVDISDYAKEAVSAMKSSSILSGMGDGSYAPKKNANRAQAAKMTAALANAANGEEQE